MKSVVPQISSHEGIVTTPSNTPLFLASKPFETTAERTAHSPLPTTGSVFSAMENKPKNENLPIEGVVQLKKSLVISQTDPPPLGISRMVSRRWGG